ncbi:MAG: SDR family NAD(P)-dependent oxidoreductase [Hyphomicrobiaceae bacterium]
MREVPRPRTVVITGASAGLGAALAIRYAAPGRKLILIARDAARLEAVAAACRERKSDVEPVIADVTDEAAMAALIAGCDGKTPIDLVIANAGVFTGHGDKRAMETAAEIAWMSRVNFEGVVNVVQPALAGMRHRRRGHVAIIGSLAALQPLADAPGYSASKAAAMAYGEALREFLIPDKIVVSLVYPGHIKTAQVADHVGALPYVVEPDVAAAHIFRRLEAKRSFIAFPWQLLSLIRAGRTLHWRARALAGNGFRFHVKRPYPP